MWYVYVLKSRASGKFYVGITQDLSRRIHEHNSGKSKFTSGHVPWNSIYHECLGNTREARIREKYLKSAAGKRYLAKVLSAAGSLPD
jgi:putative endonuclease